MFPIQYIIYFISKGSCMNWIENLDRLSGQFMCRLPGRILQVSRYVIQFPYDLKSHKSLLIKVKECKILSEKFTQKGVDINPLMPSKRDLGIRVILNPLTIFFYLTASSSF